MTTTAALLGTWVADPAGEDARECFGDVVMRFDPDGSLTYMIRGEEKEQIMLLRYRVEGDELVTNQPSAPRVSALTTFDPSLLTSIDPGGVAPDRVTGCG